MKTAWTKYFKALGMSQVLVQRARQAFHALSTALQTDIEDVFVSEYIDSDGNRQFEDLFIFTQYHIVQVRNFALEDVLDADAFGPLRNLLVSRVAFDFTEPTDKSRLHVRYHTLTGCSAELKASRENCATLARILRERLAPMLRPQAGTTYEE
jgi:hypothetical protein